jgi:fibronectin type 3 domain-containing protein
MNQFKKFCTGLLFIVLTVTGCGVKAPPIVPHSPIPQTITDLEIFSRRGTLVLQWSIPKKTTDGKKLTNLAGFHIWRRFIPKEEKGCSTCKHPFELLVELDYQMLPKKEETGKVTYWDNQVEKEGVYSYYVSSYTNAWNESMGSNLVEITWSLPPLPPVSLKATPGDQIVDLEWETLPSLWGTKEFGGFQIYRRKISEDYDLTPINQSPLQQNHFQDITVTNGEKYFYVVRSLKTTEEGTIEGKDSPEVEVIPEDLSPPATPTITMAFQSPEGIVIIWEPNLDADLAGYYVYRRMENESQPNRISSLIPKETMFLDKNFSPGITYYYSVTAVDNSPRQNESDFSLELKVATEK